MILLHNAYSLPHYAFVAVWQAIDTTVAAIKARFQQEDMMVHTNIATLMAIQYRQGSIYDSHMIYKRRLTID